MTGTLKPKLSQFTATVPCATCGQKTEMTGTQRCDNCYEVEKRLTDYLASPVAREHVRTCLEAVEAATVKPTGGLNQEP